MRKVSMNADLDSMDQGTNCHQGFRQGYLMQRTRGLGPQRQVILTATVNAIEPKHI